MKNVVDLFTSLGGTSAVARVLGVGPSTASEMKRRRSIPPEYWAQLVAEAARVSATEITYESLALAHALERGRPIPDEGPPPNPLYAPRERQRGVSAAAEAV
jgi:hypothetical protein